MQMADITTALGQPGGSSSGGYGEQKSSPPHNAGTEDISHLGEQTTTGTTIFDILSSPSAINPSFSSIFDDIDLDLECEEDEGHVVCQGEGHVMSQSEGEGEDHVMCQDGIDNLVLDTLEVTERQDKHLEILGTIPGSDQISFARHLAPDTAIREKLDKIRFENTQFQISLPIVDMKEKLFVKCFLDKLNHDSREPCMKKTETVDTEVMDKASSAADTGTVLSQGLRGESFYCNKCRVPFSSLEALHSHNRDKHVVKTESDLFPCPVCHEICASSTALNKHSRRHQSFVPVKGKGKMGEDNIAGHSCHACPYKGKTKTLLNVHVRAKHNPDRKTYTCETCGFSCVQERTFLLHKLRHQGEGKFACDQCGKLFMSMSILKRHAITHSKSRPHICPLPGCGKAFTIKSRLGDHLRSVKHRHKLEETRLNPQTKSKVKNNVPCASDNLPVEATKCSAPSNKELCDMICVYDIVLPGPEREVTENRDRETKTTSFEIIDNQETTGGLGIGMLGLDRELADQSKKMEFTRRRVQNKWFACSWQGCGQEFRDNYNLTVHMCTHTGEMQRACPYCRYRCVQKSAMDVHLRSHRKKRKLQ